MKTKLLLFTLSLMGLAARAQSLQVYDINNAVVSGQTIDIWYDVNNQAVSQDFEVKMNATSSKRIMARRQVVSSVNGTDNLFCWVNCYSANTNFSPQALPMSPGDQHVFVSHYFNYGIIGTTIVRYTLWDTLNANDSVDFTVRWHITPVSVGDLHVKHNDLFSEPFPNPSATHASISIAANKTASKRVVAVTNMAGMIVLEDTIPGDESLYEIDASALGNGTYFIALMEDSGISAVKKLVVVH